MDLARSQRQSAGPHLYRLAVAAYGGDVCAQLRKTIIAPIRREAR